MIPFGECRRPGCRLVRAGSSSSRRQRQRLRVCVLHIPGQRQGCSAALYLTTSPRSTTPVISGTPADTIAPIAVQLHLFDVDDDHDLLDRQQTPGAASARRPAHSPARRSTPTRRDDRHRNHRLHGGAVRPACRPSTSRSLLPITRRSQSASSSQAAVVGETATCRTRSSPTRARKICVHSRSAGRRCAAGWLTFDAARTFSGTPGLADAGTRF